MSWAREGRAGSVWSTELAERLATPVVRLEVRWLLREPVFLSGVAASAVVFAAYAGWPWSSDVYLVLAGLGVACVGLFTLVAANAAALRAHHHHADDLLESLPTPRRQHVVAHLASVVPAVVAAALLAVCAPGFYYYAGTAVPRLPSVVELAQGPVAVACAGVLGVVLARWLPARRVTAAAVLTLVVWQLSLQHASGPLRWFAPIVDIQVVDRAGDTLGFRRGSVAWHVVGLVGMVVLGVAVALGRLEEERRLRTLLLVGMALVVAGATLQLG